MTSPETPPGSSGPEGELESASHADERELIARCIDGDTTAFEPLVERYRQRVWRLAYQILRDREDAWDCAQEAFVRAFHSLPSFRGQSAFYTWLFRITVNVATDRQRARGAQARAFGAERVPEEEWGRTTPDPGAGPDKAAVQAEQRARIRQALDALPPKARAIIMLSDVEGLSYREIAEVLRCPIGTVMSRLHNARKRLKAALGSMLGLILWVGMSVLPSQMPAEAQAPPPHTQPSPQAQSVIRFGVRVLEAWNPGGSSLRPPVRTRAGPRPPRGLQSQRRHPSRRNRCPGRAPLGSVAEQPAACGPGRTTPSASRRPRYPAPTSAAPVESRLPILQSSRRSRAIALEGPLGIDAAVLDSRGSLARRDPRPTPRSAGPDARPAREGRAPGNEREPARLPGAPAILGGPPYGRGVLIIILWANPNIAGPPSTRFLGRSP